MNNWWTLFEMDVIYAEILKISEQKRRHWHTLLWPFSKIKKISLAHKANHEPLKIIQFFLPEGSWPLEAEPPTCPASFCRAAGQPLSSLLQPQPQPAPVGWSNPPISSWYSPPVNRGSYVKSWRSASVLAAPASASARASRLVNPTNKLVILSTCEKRPSYI